MPGYCHVFSFICQFNDDYGREKKVQRFSFNVWDYVALQKFESCIEFEPLDVFNPTAHESLKSQRQRFGKFSINCF